MLTQTIGKLATITPDCSEMDSVAEGYLKAFTSGDRMTLNRKNKEPIEVTPTARLMVAANNRPRFSDKSSGVWRRMIVVPWRVTIAEKDQVIGMDKVEWWENSGELPGIFNWAIAGLFRLRKQRRLTRPAICIEAMKDYQLEVNPTKLFIQEHLIADPIKYEKTSIVYDLYKKWAIENNYRAVSDKTFGRELQRLHPGVKRDRKRIGGADRCYIYEGVMLGNERDREEDEKIGIQYQQEIFQ